MAKPYSRPQRLCATLVTLSFESCSCKISLEDLLMCRGRALLTAVLVFAIAAQATPFVVFPKAGQLPSPDGRFILRNADRKAPLSEYVGTFHSLILEETGSGRSRELCDYVGVAAVAWAKNDFIIVTQYVSKRTSRALVFVADNSRDPVVIDKASLTVLVPINLRPQLRENDRVFVEGLQVEGETLTLRVWGYGQHDPNGFRWRCEYNLLGNAISCDGASP